MVRMPIMKLEEDPEVREFEAARLLGISARTIQRRRIIEEFPAPDSYEIMGKRKIPFWKLSSIRAYQRSRRVRA